MTTLEADLRNEGIQMSIEMANETLRAAVQARLDATPHVPSADEVIERFSNNESAAVRTLRQSMEAVKDRHRKYGPPAEHFARTAALVNAAFGTTFTASDWALVMVLDKVARQRGPQATSDSAVDIAGYAACHEECRSLYREER